ncbi:MAG: MtrB/PioB family decaheme-associated outer membrane protein [Rhodocyclaceae bacterium]|nr:MtrB/PioB family decaheme-associated outer membrane protein [Rhodocyclaceae bacterium]
MRKTASIFRLSACAAALMAAFGQAVADEEELRWLSEPDSFVSLGLGNWSHDRNQLGIYDGMREGGIYGLFDLRLVSREEASGNWFRVEGRNLGLDNRRISAEASKQGDVGATVNYQRIVREHPLEITTGLQGIGTDTLTVSGAGDDALPFREVKLGTSRDIVQVGFYKFLTEGLKFKLGFRSEEKDGTRHYGVGSAPLFLVEPVDSTTEQIDLTVEYTAEKLQLAGGYVGSWYSNSNKLIMATVNGAAQPGTTSGPNPTPLSQPLDSQAHQVFFNGGYSFTPSTRGTLKLSRTVATQDEQLPTYSLAAPNDPFVGAPSSLDGKIVTSVAEIGLSAHPIADLSLNGHLRYHDVDDQTPLAAFVGNNTTGEGTVHNTPHSYKTVTGKVEAAYRLPMRFRVIGGVDVKQQDRSAPTLVEERYVPYRTEVDETTLRLQLRRSMSETLNGAVTFLHSKRDGNTYIAPHDPEIFDTINPLHIADRTRDKVRLSLDWSPTEVFGVQFNVESAKDDYDHDSERPYGLQDGSARLISLDARYALSDDWQLTGYVSHDETEANQLAGRWPRNAASPVPDMVKDAELRDKGDSVGIGVRGAIGERVKLGGDVQWTRTTSSYDEATDPARAATEAPLEDIENKLTRVSMFARYDVAKNREVRLDLVHERWETDDWSWSFADGSPFTYGTTTDGTTVFVQPKQTSSFVGVRYIVRFQ